MPDNIEYIREELKALLAEVLKLGVETEKGEDETDNRERIREKLVDIIANIMPLLTEFSDEEREEITHNIEETLVKKNQVERFKRFSEELSSFLTSGFQVVTGPTQEEMRQQLFEINKLPTTLRSGY